MILRSCITILFTEVELLCEIGYVFWWRWDNRFVNCEVFEFDFQWEYCDLLEGSMVE